MEQNNVEGDKVTKQTQEVEAEAQEIQGLWSFEVRESSVQEVEPFLGDSGLFRCEVGLLCSEDISECQNQWM